MNIVLTWEILAIGYVSYLALCAICYRIFFRRYKLEKLSRQEREQSDMFGLDNVKYDVLPDMNNRRDKIERMGPDEKQQTKSTRRIVGLAQAIGEWTAKVLGEKARSFGIGIDESQETGVGMYDKPQGYWQSLLQLTGHKEKEPDHWQKHARRTSGRRGGRGM